jgi:uncharacterized protein (UPF0261 family)
VISIATGEENMNTNAGAGITTAVDAPPVLIPLAHAHAPVPVRAPDHRLLRDTRGRAHARVPVHSTGSALALAPVHGKEKGTMDTLVRVAQPAVATGMHVLVPASARVPVFLPVLVVVAITSTLVVCPVSEGDVVLLPSDMHLVNLILRVNVQDENANTMCIASKRRQLVVLSAAAAAVPCLDNLSLNRGRLFY